jgi:hypothetical protein
VVGLRGRAEVQAALLVELLSGVEIKRVTPDTAAQTFWSNVAKRSVLPAVRDGKDYASVLPYENVLLDVGRRDRGALRFGLSGGARRSRMARSWGVFGRRVRRHSIVGCDFVTGRSNVPENDRRGEQKATEPERSSTVEPAAAAATISANRSKVRKIKSKAGRILEICAVESGIYAVAIAIHMAGRSRMQDGCAGPGGA